MSPGAVGGGYGFVVTSIDLDPDRWHQLGAFFGDLEAAGCDAIWLSDHLFSGHPSAEPFVLAAVAAASTSRCRIGTGVVQLALRRSAVVAKAASTLQLVSGGRFCLGVGVGRHSREFERVGVDFHGRGAAVDRLLKELSDHWQETDDWFGMRPRATVDVWVGGTSRAALRRTAEFGSGWLALFLTPDRFAEANRRLDDALEARGRRPDSVERRMVVLVCPTDGEWSRADALRWASRQFPSGSGGIERHVITGSVAACVDAIREFEHRGAAGIDLQILHPEPIPRFAALRSGLMRGRSEHG